MRLIDADKIGNATSSDLEIYSFDLVPYIKVEDLLNFIDNLPTAYDIEKVVEELEFKKSVIWQDTMIRVFIVFAMVLLLGRVMMKSV